jgi:hypothetical protein
MYKVKILTPGHMMVFRNKQCRTPVIFEHVLENEIAYLKLQASKSSLKIVIEDEDVKSTKKIHVTHKKKKKEKLSEEQILIEKIKTSEPKSILDQLIIDNS